MFSCLKIGGWVCVIAELVTSQTSSVQAVCSVREEMTAMSAVTAPIWPVRGHCLSLCPPGSIGVCVLKHIWTSTWSVKLWTSTLEICLEFYHSSALPPSNSISGCLHWKNEIRWIWIGFHRIFYGSFIHRGWNWMSNNRCGNRQQIVVLQQSNIPNEQQQQQKNKLPVHTITQVTKTHQVKEASQKRGHSTSFHVCDIVEKQIQSASCYMQTEGH